MFVLSEMSDTIRVLPHMFHKKLDDAIKTVINKQLANKIKFFIIQDCSIAQMNLLEEDDKLVVVQNVGLCVSLWDISEIKDSFIFPGDGSSHTTVLFRYCVFRPFMDEILVGKIRGCSSEGVHVSLGFFDDITITADSLQHPSKFNQEEQLWVWQYETDEGSHELFMDIGEDIRFRVVDECFVDTSPTCPESATDGEAPEDNKKSPYSLIGSISEPGLGLLSWWNN